MRRTFALLASAAGSALLLGGIAGADTVTTTFEPPTFHEGSVDGQDGWHSAKPTDIPALPNGYDQEVVAVSGIPGFGSQSLRHSNGFNEPTGEFQFQTYSKPTAQPAGEAEANTEYSGEFSFITTKPDVQQPGLFMTMSPDNSTGGRMSAVRLLDEEDGIRAIIFDTPETNGRFAAYDAGLYRRDRVHTVRFWIKFVPGPDNDIVRIFIDGTDIGNKLGVCFTTWENFYRAVQRIAVPVTNSIEFRASGGEVPNVVDEGFLFDNVTNTTAAGAGPAGCTGGGDGPPPPDDIVVDKTTATRVAQPGDLVTYRITVRNRGDATARRLRLCDRVPRALSFVRATRRLDRAAGRRRCLTIRLLRPGGRRTFLATFRLRAGVTADTVTNSATADTPVVSEPHAPEAAGDPSPFPTGQPRRRRIARDRRTIGVLSEQAQCPAAVSSRRHATC